MLIFAPYVSMDSTHFRRVSACGNSANAKIALLLISRLLSLSSPCVFGGRSSFIASTPAAPAGYEIYRSRPLAYYEGIGEYDKA